LKYIAAFVLSFVTTMAAAQDLPALFSVTDVASNDVLNIRAEPTSAAPIIGSLTPNATRIEVVARSANGRWGLVNSFEQTGWASLRFLERQPFQAFPPSDYRCFGTEPFWDVSVIGDDVQWSALGEDPISMTRDWTGTPMRQDRFAVRAFGDLSFVSLLVRKQMCSDGMSDRAYGLEVDVILDGAYNMGTQVYSGCCTLSD
jgi:uncharacterized membrane protein